RRARTRAHVDGGRAPLWRSGGGTVAAAVNARLWDAGAGAYLDSAVGPSRHAQDGSGYAVVSGVAHQARATRALGYLSAHTGTPYGNAFMDNDTLVPDGSK